MKKTESNKKSETSSSKEMSALSEEKSKKKEEKSEKKEKAKVLSKSSVFNLDFEEMARAGLYFGHRTSRCHPKMKPYISGVRNTIHIINLEKTAEKLKEALKFIQSLFLENKVLLLVGTKIQLRDLVKDLAKKYNLPYVTERWLGGTITNFDNILKRINYFKDLEKKKAEGELDKYSKKERAKIEKEIQDLRTNFEGIKELNRLPDAIFVLDMNENNLAVKEAKMKGIKVIAIADTNVDPTLADYPIPANDDAISSVKYILDKVSEAIEEVKK